MSAFDDPDLAPDGHDDRAEQRALIDGARKPVRAVPPPLTRAEHVAKAEHYLRIAASPYTQNPAVDRLLKAAKIHTALAKLAPITTPRDNHYPKEA